MSVSPHRFFTGGNEFEQLFDAMDAGERLHLDSFEARSTSGILLPKPKKIATEFQMSTDNSGVDVTYSGFNPADMHHRIKSAAVWSAILLSNHQTTEMAYTDVSKFTELRVGEEFLARMYTDDFGAPGMLTIPGFDKRFANTLRGLMTVTARPRNQEVNMCHLSEMDIFASMLGAMQHGVRFSWNIIRHTLDGLVGDYLYFYPSEFPGHGCEAMDLIGNSVDPASYTVDQPFDPGVIYVCLPWMSHQEFGREYTIAVAKGRKRLFIANLGVYAGGDKKPGNCQYGDTVLPSKGYSVRHWSVGQLRTGDFVAKGDGTGVGKTEVTAPERVLDDNRTLVFEDPESGEAVVSIDISDDSPILKDNPHVVPLDGGLGGRSECSDDLTAVMHQPAISPGQGGGFPSMVGLNMENYTYRRIDLETGKGEEPLAHDFAEGRISRRERRYWFQVEFKSGKFQMGKYRLLNKDGTISDVQCTNPRLTHPNHEGIPGHRPATMENPAHIRTILKSVAVPSTQEGWWMPPFTVLTVNEFEMLDRDCTRGNKNNPAMAPVGSDIWVPEGPGGKQFFTVDGNALVYERDQPFYRGIPGKMKIWFVSEGHCSGLKQRFKYSGTFIWRFVWEHFRDRLLAAPLIPLPGIATGSVPDLDWVCGRDQIPKRLWHPDEFPVERLRQCARVMDLWAYEGANKLLGSSGLSQHSKMRLEDDMAKIAVEISSH